MNTEPEPKFLEATREIVAGEVRAELARRKLNSNNLPKLLGNSQSYWSRRLHAEQPFDIDDLARLSALLGVPMSHFVPHNSPDGDGRESPLSYSKRRPPLYIVDGYDDWDWPAEAVKQKQVA